MISTVRKIKHSGADWLEKQECFKNPSALGIKVADILGQVYLGIYHISDSVTSKKVDWQSETKISVNVYGDMATFDKGELTLLILCCVEAEVSVRASGSFKGYMKLTFQLSKSKINLAARSQNLSLDQFNAEGIVASYAKKKVFEMDNLVELVLLAHLAMVRISLRGRCNQVLEMQFNQRVSRVGAVWERHPDIEAAQAIFAPYVLALTQAEREDGVARSI